MPPQLPPGEFVKLPEISASPQSEQCMLSLAATFVDRLGDQASPRSLHPGSKEDVLKGHLCHLLLAIRLLKPWSPRHHKACFIPMC